MNIPSFRFEAGKRYALVGANGSGKSTLLRILAGSIPADTGKVEYAPELKGQFGYMPQKPYIYDFSVLKNVMIAIKNKPAKQAIAMAALEKVGMASLLSARGARLSGGEAQRVAFARMIALAYPLLLLDEPTSALDIGVSGQIEQELLSYCHRNNTTLIFATHSLAQAQRLADILVLIDRGEIAETGNVRQVIHSPQTKAAQDFLKNWQVT